MYSTNNFPLLVGLLSLCPYVCQVSLCFSVLLVYTSALWSSFVVRLGQVEGYSVQRLGSCGKRTVMLYGMSWPT